MSVANDSRILDTDLSNNFLLHLMWRNLVHNSLYLSIVESLCWTVRSDTKSDQLCQYPRSCCDLLHSLAAIFVEFVVKFAYLLHFELQFFQDEEELVPTKEFGETDCGMCICLHVLAEFYLYSHCLLSVDYFCDFLSYFSLDLSKR